jgi:hypothetical protein
MMAGIHLAVCRELLPLLLRCVCICRHLQNARNSKIEVQAC